MKTLIFCSGGLDSVVALVKILEETDDDVHVHHMFYYTDEERGDAEKQAIEKIVPYCQRIRAFKYTTSTHDFTQIFCPYDTHVCRFVAAQICRGNSGINRVVSGWCKDDTNPNTLSDIIFKAALCGNPDNIEWYYPCLQITKYEEREYLRKSHPDLLKFIHYCRKPIKNEDKWNNCNKCSTCLQMNNLHWQYING